MNEKRAAGIPLLAPGAVFKFSLLDIFSRLEHQCTK